jgi:chaperone modulatory protein CbpM
MRSGARLGRSPVTRLGEAQVVERLGTLSVAELRVWCEAGWVSPARGEAGPVFDEVDLARIRLVRELRDDLGLDEEAVPVVLSLVDQLYGMRREFRALARAVDQQPAEVAAHIRAAYRALAERA